MMIDLVSSLDNIKHNLGDINFRLKRQGIYKIIVPFFYEDGDMYDIFLELSPSDPNRLRISDHGLTVMKLSYVFDFDTPTKKEVLNSIVSQNRANIVNGEIFVDASPDMFQQYLYQMLQTLMKVSNLDVLSRETVKSMFYDLFNEFVREAFRDLNIVDHYTPMPSDENLVVDYKIDARRPIFLYGVKDSAKASKVIISCLNFQQNDIPFRSLIVHDNLEKLDSFNQKQITNISDKQFFTLEGFKKSGLEYIKRELSA